MEIAVRDRNGRLVSLERPEPGTETPVLAFAVMGDVVVMPNGQQAPILRRIFDPEHQSITFHLRSALNDLPDLEAVAEEEEAPAAVTKPKKKQGGKA